MIIVSPWPEGCTRKDSVRWHARLAARSVLAVGWLCAGGCGDSSGPGTGPRLTFVVEPVSVGIGSPLKPAIVVAVVANAGRIIESWTDTVTLTLESASGSAVLQGTAGLVPVGGVAVFDDLGIETVGAGYRLVAHSGSLEAVVSERFTIHDIFVSSLVSVGREHTCALVQDGSAFCWGDNAYGQLGDGTQQSRPVPTPAATGLRFESISVGLGHSCGRTAGGVAYCWGDNRHGQLGDGTTEGSLTPRQVSLASSIVALDAGRDHTCAVTNDGSAYCWGRNEFGRLGDGTEITRTAPTLVTGGLQFVSISAGTLHTCGLATGGRAYCWGNNLRGKIGDSTGTDRSVPTEVATPLRFASISAGDASCGVTTDADTYCWGRNRQRSIIPGFQLVVPTALAGDPGFNWVTMGFRVNCGIAADNTLYCWGAGFEGELGNGTTQPTDLPTPILPNQGFISVSTSDDHTCGVTTDGLTYCWGRNTSGQLGSGSNTIGWTIPVPVWAPEGPGAGA